MSNGKEIRYFTKELLNELLEKNGATLIGEYKNINSKSKISFKCKCGNEGCKSFSVMPTYGIHCRKCVNKIMTEKTKITNMDRYGCEDPNQLSSIKDKIKKTFINKYGVEYSLQAKVVKEKIKETNIKRYGFENPFQNKEIKSKITNTLLNKYGVEHPLQNKEIYERFQNTLIKNHNVTLPYYSEELKERGRKSCLEKYGVEHPLQNAEVINKIKKTCLKKYGVESPMQCNIVHEQNQKNSVKYKQYTMPSGEIRNIQGYEGFAIRDLLKIYTEDEIKTTRKDIPRITYVLNSKNKYYFPDIYIPCDNKIIEVKSKWTYECKEDNIQIKSDATNQAGYKYEIWIYDAKGNRLN